MMTSTDTVIVGEGITGLGIAHWLKKSGGRVLLLAKEREAGGTMRSVRENGFLSETGANSALETSPLFKELVADCGLENEFLYAAPSGKNRFILRDGKLLALPLSPPAFVATPLFSASAKLRLLREPFIGRASTEESVAQFVARRLGDEFLNYAIDPFVAGVFAGRPDRLSVRSAFPKLYALEEKYGGLIKGMIGGARDRKKRTEKAKDRAETFSFRGGMQALPKAIAAKLGNDVVYGARVTRVIDRGAAASQTQNRYTLNYEMNGTAYEIHANDVVFAIPAYEVAGLLRPLSPSTADTLDSIYYPPVVSVFFGFRREDIAHPLNGFGYLIPSRENRKILGCLWNSSLFPDRAPEGMVAVNAFVGGARQPEMTELDDTAVAAITLEELSSAMQIQGKPVYSSMTRWPKAIPQYELGYQQKMNVLAQFENDHPGIVLAGNYRGGISVGDCVLSARRIAGEISARRGLATAS